MMSSTFSIENEIDELFRNKMKEFTEWASKNWQTSETEAETLTEPALSPKDYARGYNDGVSSITDALGCYLDEYGL